VITIAGAFIRRTLRNPMAIMFAAVVPLVIALVFGFAEREANDSLPVGLVVASRGALAVDLARELHNEPALRIRALDSRAALLNAVRRGDVTAGIVIPADYERTVLNRGKASVEVVGDKSASAFYAVRAASTLAVDRENEVIKVGRKLAASTGAPLAAQLARAHAVTEGTQPVIERRTAHAATRAAGLGRVTAGMLVFFMFVVCADYATELVKDRRRGIVARMGTAPISDGLIVGGEMLGRFVICLLQAIVIIVVGALAFDVRWGDPIAVAAVIVLFAALSTSTSVLLGCTLRLNENNAQFTTSGLTAGLGIIGGCFFSLALVSTWLRVAGHVSPHAWAVDALGNLEATDAGIGSVAIPLLVLASITVVVFALAVRALRAAFRT
jgi:ABC-2 type transport system permease protein